MVGGAAHARGHDSATSGNQHMVNQETGEAVKLEKISEAGFHMS